MKLTSALLFVSTAIASATAIAQTSGAAKPHPATHAAGAAPACVKLPELSPKLPALPAGSPCAKPLYTLTTVPTIRIDYTSPQEGSTLQQSLGLEPTTFSLAYIDTKVGTGELAAPNKWYTIHYTGYLADGTKFDSSYDHPGKEPLTFQIGQHQVVVGWDTGFAGMRVGGKRRLFIPYQLAYGPTGRPPTIPAKAELIFDLEFISQSDQQPAPKTPPAPPAAAKPAPVPPPSGGASPPSGSTPAPTPAAPPASTAPATSATPPKPQ